MKLLTILFSLCISSAAFAQEMSLRSMNDFESNLQMRSSRKVGAGLVYGGVAGQLGASIDLNIEDQDGALLTAGSGTGYRTFSLAWKHNFEGGILTPFFTAGWSHWYSSSDENKQSSYVLSSVGAIEDQKPIRSDFITGSLGVQYNQLDGEYVGFSILLKFLR